VTTLPEHFAQYLGREWRLLICHPLGKAPLGKLVPHGVDDATSDPDVLAEWFAEYPDANWAVACGAPGPQVLDIDYPDRAPERVLAAARQAPIVRSHRTERSGHAYFEGTDRGTVTLRDGHNDAWGELRGAGNYAMVPPSVHPCGKRYVWVREPRGKLPSVPHLEKQGATAGSGDQPPPEPVPPGGMHEHLLDIALRCARARLHPVTIERVLLAEFEAVRVAGAVYAGSAKDTRRMAQWAGDPEKCKNRKRAELTAQTDAQLAAFIAKREEGRDGRDRRA
jgi:hypothetical protein